MDELNKMFNVSVIDTLRLLKYYEGIQEVIFSKRLKLMATLKEVV